MITKAQVFNWGILPEFKLEYYPVSKNFFQVKPKTLKQVLHCVLSRNVHELSDAGALKSDNPTPVCRKKKQTKITNVFQKFYQDVNSKQQILQIKTLLTT